MMPTSQKLVAALGLAFVSYIVSVQILPQLPEGANYGGLAPSNIVIGILIGWAVVGRRSPNRDVTPITNGMTGVLSLVIWALFLHACQQMVARALSRRYSDPFTALLDIFNIMIDYAAYLFTPGIAATLLIGSIVVGVLTERVARLYG